jgi:hypothetical protein
MKYAIEPGKIVEILPPPSPGYYGIDSAAWRLAVGRRFRLKKFPSAIDGFVTLDTNDMFEWGYLKTPTRLDAYYWPAHCMKVVDEACHPSEVF